MAGTFEVHVSRDDIKFHCAHFVAYRGFRERLHGHNYTVQVSMRSHAAVGDWAGVSSDGYVVDFGDIKAAARRLCKQLNERFLCPMRSDVIAIERRPAPGGGGGGGGGGAAGGGGAEDGERAAAADEQLCLTCEDGAFFSFPATDCAQLPLVHSTAEELAHFLWVRLVRELGLSTLHARRVTALSVSVAEAPYQRAVYTCDVPEDEAALARAEASPCPQARAPRPCGARAAAAAAAGVDGEEEDDR